jgi:HSF-type DNA-binding
MSLSRSESSLLLSGGKGRSTEDAQSSLTSSSNSQSSSPTTASALTSATSTGTETSAATASHNSIVPKFAPDLSFPWRLFLMLNDASSKGFQDIVSWIDHGNAFQIKDNSHRLEQILQQYFNATKYESLRRQIANYGFTCVSKKDRKCKVIPCRHLGLAS